MAKVTLDNVTTGFQTTDNINSNNDAIEAFSDKCLTRDGVAPNAMEANLDMNSNNILNVGDIDTASLSVNGVQVVPSSLSTISPTLLNYDIGLTGSVPRTISDKLDDFVSVKDFGAKGDGVTDDLIPIQFALTASDRVYFPEGTYLTSGSITLQRDQYLYGEGREKSIIKFTGATEGFVYDSASKVDGTLTFDSLMIRGNSTALVLVKLKNVGSVVFNNCIIRNTSTSCISLDGETISFVFRDGYLEAFTNYGVHCKGSLVSLIYFECCRFNGVQSDGTLPAVNSAGIFIDPAMTTGLSIAKFFQVNVNGGRNINPSNEAIGSFIRAEGPVFQLIAEQCYAEFIQLPGIYITGSSLVTMARIEQCNFSTQDSNAIDFGNAVAHNYVSISQCRRPGSTGNIFNPGSTADWTFLQGSRESGTQFVNGFSGVNNLVRLGTSGVRHITELRSDGSFKAFGGIDLNNSATITNVNSGDIQVSAATSGKSVLLRTAGTERVSVGANGLLIKSVGLGVPNSVAATGPVGSVVRKLQIFDASGASLGFIPIYNSIT